MKKNLFLVFLVIINFQLCFASTTVPAGNVSGTWTLAGSPYLIQGDIQILDATTLTIQPGVTVNFQGTYKLNVQGRLLAIGTAVDTIIFTASNTTNGWRGIRFDQTPSTNDTSKIVYCKLQYGKAIGTFPYNCGGALYLKNFSNAIISHCLISNCSADAVGGGIYCDSSSITINYNKILNNLSVNGSGIYCLSGIPNISYNIISHNTSSANGGGISSWSNAIISNNIISYNTFIDNGGGIIGSKNEIITYNTISNNTAVSSNGIYSYGGGIYCNGSSSVSISNNSISNNTADYGGGIMFNSVNTSTSLIYNIISNNTASIGGGGIYLYNSTSAISNNVISNNNGSSGGGIYYDRNQSGIDSITNNTISNNSAVNGGAFYCTLTPEVVFRNCVLWGNTASAGGAQVFLNDDAGALDFYYCDVQGGSAAFGLNGNQYGGNYGASIETDPKFVSPSSGSGAGFNGLVADWSLQSNSTCINTGDPNGTYPTYPATDKAGNTRVTVCRIDMGAYEYQNGIPLTATVSQTQQSLCYGDSTATATVVPAGGAPSDSYTYSWNTTPGQTTATAVGLKAATYSVTITETSYGCSITKTITIAQPQQIIFTPVPNPVLCKNGNTGSITGINALGGTGTYQYSKDSGLTYQSANIFTGLIAGTYHVVIKDGNNCITPAQSIVITEPPLLTFTTTHGNFHCINGNSGNDTITASGGIGINQYSKDGGLTYQLSNIFTGLNANTYQITVKDSNNCIAPMQNLIITPVPYATFITQDESSSLYCDGSIKASLTGGTGTILPTWNTTPVQTTDSIGALCPGNYILTLVDSNGCTNTYTETIQAGPIPPTPPICLVTVDSTFTHNLVVWEKTSLDMIPIDSFLVYREIGTNSYHQIGAVSHDSMSTFDDFGANPATTGYRYKLKSKNAHGVLSVFSDYHNTIYLTNTGGNFNWTPYQVENITTPVFTYNVYRDDNSTGNFQLIGNTTGNQFGYTDLQFSSFPNASYYVEAVMSSGACNPTRSSIPAARSNVKHFGTTGFEQLVNNAAINIFPNPSTGKFSIQSNSGNIGMIEIYNVLGEQIYLSELKNKTSNEIDLSGVPKGIYFVKISDDNKGVINKKIVIQ